MSPRLGFFFPLPRRTEWNSSTAIFSRGVSAPRETGPSAVNFVYAHEEDAARSSYDSPGIYLSYITRMLEEIERDGKRGKWKDRRRRGNTAKTWAGSGEGAFIDETW